MRLRAHLMSGAPVTACCCSRSRGMQCEVALGIIGGLPAGDIDS
jgi:hypothetical protein